MNWKRLPLTLASLLRLIRPSHSLLAIGSSSSSSRQPLPILRAGASATMSSEATATATAYEELLKELDAIKQLSRVSSILGYDKMVFMPAAAAADRGKQSAALASVIHEKSTDPKLGALIEAAEQERDNDSTGAYPTRQIRNLELAKKNYVKATCIPTELAARKAKLNSEAYAAWAKAREADDFGLFSDLLGSCIDTAIEMAQCEQKHMKDDSNKSDYAILLDTYETGMDPSRIDSIFAQIKTALVPLIDRVLGPDATPPSKEPMEREVPIDAQKELCEQMVKAIGYEGDRGRIDVSVHPFTSSSGPNDVRITSRFSAGPGYREGLIASIHECGHAIYEQNLPVEAEPINEALSMGLHESQSIFWERHVALSQPFWLYATPIVNEKYGFSCTPEEYYGAVNAAGKSFIRVEADELTYPLHVILRYEIEREFIKGDLKAADIPAKWNKDFKECFGLEVPSDAKGCLQDIHWSMSAFGYFPTYLLGAATAAQLEHYIRKDIPDFDAKIAAGEFVEIKSWLTEKVHKHGKLYKSLDDHLEAQLGEKLNPEYFIKYLTNKYTAIYKC